jgi:predicted DNA-binding transcriptional regulator AlpA
MEMYRWIENNQFPQPIKIVGSSYWLEKDILDFFQNQKTA